MHFSMISAVAAGESGMNEFYRANTFVVVGDIAQITSALFLSPIIKGIAEAQDDVARSKEF
jgi:hypothetical protein